MDEQPLALLLDVRERPSPLASMLPPSLVRVPLHGRAEQAEPSFCAAPILDLVVAHPHVVRRQHEAPPGRRAAEVLLRLPVHLLSRTNVDEGRKSVCDVTGRQPMFDEGRPMMLN